MRENKFRAWDKINKAMVHWKMILDHCNRFSFLYNTNYDFMQYTGLNDKNGVEIYGDSDLLTDDEGRILMLKWINKWAGYGVFFFDNNEWSHIFDPIDLYSEEGDCLKLLRTGNIYENPELLKAN